MKFRFLGDGDCPDWLLAEINTLSRMTSIKMKTLGQIVMKSLTEGELDEAKIKKITQDAKLGIWHNFYAKAAFERFQNDKSALERKNRLIDCRERYGMKSTECFFCKELSDAKAMIAALELIFTSSARYGVSAADLNSELQQLGLPREHSTAVARIHTDYCPQLTATLSSQSLRVSRLSSVKVVSCDSSSPFSTIGLTIKKVDGSEEETTLNISKEDVQMLLTELKRARTLMESL